VVTRVQLLRRWEGTSQAQTAVPDRREGDHAWVGSKDLGLANAVHIPGKKRNQKAKREGEYNAKLSASKNSTKKEKIRSNHEREREGEGN